MPDEIALMFIPILREFNRTNGDGKPCQAESTGIESIMTNILLKYEEWNFQRDIGFV
jgi:hypothetical protein